MPTIQEVRAKLLAEHRSKSHSYARPSEDKSLFPFWDADQTTVRLLPDSDETNPLIWRIKDVIRLPFVGTVNSDYPTNREVIVTLTSPSTFEMKCPIAEATKHLWKDDPDTARRYWRRRSYIMQGFVRSSSLSEDLPPENPIRRFMFSKSLYEVIHADLVDIDNEHILTDYEHGRDLRIIKTNKGGYANYATSSFARKSSALTDAEWMAIEEYGLYDLKKFQGLPTTDEELQMMAEMAQASLAGEPFDVKRWGSRYRAVSPRVLAAQ